MVGVAVAKSPNVLIIYVDDMGYGDLGCYGAKGWKTPRLDGLAAEGMRFSDFYVSQPVCSASRASLMTGCYANRIGVAGALGGEGGEVRDQCIAEADAVRVTGAGACSVTMS